MLEIKKVGNRYYYFSYRQLRSFPIKKAEALAKIENGEAELVESFITDQVIPEVPEAIVLAKEETEQVETNSNTVVSFANRFQAKQEKESLNNAMSHFLNNILPNMNMEEMKRLTQLASNSDNFIEELMRTTLRITMQKADSEYNGGI